MMLLEKFLMNAALAKRMVKLNLIVIAALFASNLLLAYLAIHLSSRSTTILVPMNLNTPVTVSSEGVSPAYLSLMGAALTGLRFDFTPKTIEHQYNWIANFLAPQTHAAIFSQLMEEKKSVEAQGLASSFAVTDVQPDVRNLTVAVTGSLSRWVQGAPLPPVTTTFLLKFKNQNGTLILSDWLEEKNDKT